MPDTLTSDLPASLSKLLLDVLNLTAENAPGGFQARTLDMLSERVRFDAGSWGYAHYADGRPTVHNIFLHRLRTDGITEHLAAHSHDALAGLALDTPGRAVMSGVARGETLGGLAPDAFASTHSLAHCCVVAVPHEFSGLAVFIALYRQRGRSPFVRDEARLLELAAPHFSAAFDLYRRRSLMTNAGYSSIGGGAALADHHGVLHLTDEPFLRLLRIGWPGWRGPRLPVELLATHLTDVHRPGVVVSRRPLTGEALDLILARPDGAADLLTFRQAQIARAFAEGRSHREIASELGISPATVRNHLRMIYSALHVSSKLELAAALASAPRLSLHRGIDLPS